MDIYLINFWIAEAASCSKQAITRICTNLQLSGSVRAPPNKGGRPRGITTVLMDGCPLGPFIWKAWSVWLFSCGMSSKYKQRSPASGVLFLEEVGQTRQLNKRQKSKTRTYTMNTFIHQYLALLYVLSWIDSPCLKWAKKLTAARRALRRSYTVTYGHTLVCESWNLTWLDGI